MQSRLERHGPVATAIAVLFALAVAFALGAGLVHALEPAGAVPGPSRAVLVESQSGGGDLQADACLWVDHHKAC